MPWSLAEPPSHFTAVKLKDADHGCRKSLDPDWLIPLVIGGVAEHAQEQWLGEQSHRQASARSLDAVVREVAFDCFFKFDVGPLQFHLDDVARDNVVAHR